MHGQETDWVAVKFCKICSSISKQMNIHNQAGEFISRFCNFAKIIHGGGNWSGGCKVLQDLFFSFKTNEYSDRTGEFSGWYLPMHGALSEFEMWCIAVYVIHKFVKFP